MGKIKTMRSIDKVDIQNHFLRVEMLKTQGHCCKVRTLKMFKGGVGEHVLGVWNTLPGVVADMQESEG